MPFGVLLPAKAHQAPCLLDHLNVMPCMPASPYSQMPFVFFHSHIQHLLVFVLSVIPRGVSQLLSPTMPLKAAWLLTKLDVLYRAGQGSLSRAEGH